MNDCMGPDRLFYRLNEAKTVEWLKRKCKRVASHLEDSMSRGGATKDGDAFVDGFVEDARKSTNKENEKADNECRRRQTRTQYMTSASRIIEAYVSKRWMKPLRDALGLADTARAEKKRKSVVDEAVVKRSSGNDMDDVLELISGAQRASKKPKTLADNRPTSIAQKRLAKTNTKNMKSMFSYFGKK